MTTEQSNEIIAELLEALKELQRFVPSLSRLADDHLQHPDNCNKALANIESLIIKYDKK